MDKKICAYLIFVCVLVIASDAYAQPRQEEAMPPPSPRAQKVLKTLNSIGVNDPHVQAFVGYVDSSVKDKYLAFSEHEIAGGKLKVGYDLSEGFHPAEAQIRFTHEETGTTYTANKNGFIAGYQLHF